MKLPPNLKNLRDALNKIESSPDKIDLDLYLLAGPYKKVRIIRTSEKAFKTVTNGLQPGSAIVAMADVSVRLGIGKGLSVCVPLCDVPVIVSQLSAALDKALILAERVQAKEAKAASVVSSPPTE